MTEIKYTVSNIKFVVPTLEFAQTIFEQGLGLKPEYQDEDDFRSYNLNDDTSLSVLIESEVARYDWPWNHLAIWSTRSNLLATYKRLKKIYKKVELNIRESEDKKKKKYSLKITIGLNAEIYVYDLDTKDDNTLYYPKTISKHFYEPKQIFVQLPKSLYKRYKTQNKITNEKLEIEEIRLLFNKMLHDYLEKKITLKAFAGLSDELNRQFNSPKNVRIYAGEAHLHTEWTPAMIALAWGVELFFARENKNDKRYENCMERITKYYNKYII